MALQNDIIIAPISIYDVQRCFGRTYSDIGSLIIYSGMQKKNKRNLNSFTKKMKGMQS